MAYVNNTNNGLGYFEPEVTRTFLPGCRNCGGAHPLARKPKQPEDTCPDCGQPATQAGEPQVDKANLGFSPKMVVARSCLALGKMLTKLSKGI